MTWNVLQGTESLCVCFTALALAGVLLRAGWGRLCEWPPSGWVAVALPFIALMCSTGYAAINRILGHPERLTGPVPALFQALLVFGQLYLIYRVVSGTLLSRSRDP